jgi:hypothetical protein
MSWMLRRVAKQKMILLQDDDSSLKDNSRLEEEKILVKAIDLCAFVGRCHMTGIHVEIQFVRNVMS